VLDIGSGLGFFKSLVIRRGGDYLGIEPECSSYEAACRIYGNNGYVNGFFPDDCPLVKFDVVLVNDQLEIAVEEAQHLFKEFTK
jgi:hypothetical protein